VTLSTNQQNQQIFEYLTVFYIPYYRAKKALGYIRRVFFKNKKRHFFFLFTSKKFDSGLIEIVRKYYNNSTITVHK
jgi:hypothetical protein